MFVYVFGACEYHSPGRWGGVTVPTPTFLLIEMIFLCVKCLSRVDRLSLHRYLSDRLRVRYVERTRSEPGREIKPGSRMKVLAAEDELVGYLHGSSA